MSNFIDHVKAPAPRFLMRAAIVERLLRRCGYLEPRPISVLEIGPGFGDIVDHLSAQNLQANVDLIEFNPETIAHLKERFSDRKNIEISSDDFMKNESKKKYDLIMAFEVLEHIDEDIAFLRKIHERLKKQGALLLSVPAYMHKWQAVDEVAGHVRRYEPEELKQKLAQSAFEIDFFTPYGFPVTNLLYPIRNFYFGKKKVEPDKSKATKKSGISRGLVKKFPTKLIWALLVPFFRLQTTPGVAKYGDGLLVYARPIPVK